jgi:hypothetical protein
VRAYRQFLIRATASKLMSRVEGWLNLVCPKSVILYAEKRGKQPAPVVARPVASATA